MQCSAVGAVMVSLFNHSTGLFLVVCLGLCVDDQNVLYWTACSFLLKTNILSAFLLDCKKIYVLQSGINLKVPHLKPIQEIAESDFLLIVRISESRVRVNCIAMLHERM